MINPQSNADCSLNYLYCNVRLSSKNVEYDHKAGCAFEEPS